MTIKTVRNIIVLVILLALFLVEKDFLQFHEPPTSPLQEIVSGPFSDLQQEMILLLVQQQIIQVNLH